MSWYDTAVRLVYLVSAACFVSGLHLMKSPRTARRGNLLSAAGMGAAVVATLVAIAHAGSPSAFGWGVLLIGAGAGTVAGRYAARRVKMTAMPQLVSLFNAAGGGAAALLAVDDLFGTDHAAARTAVTGAADIVIGAVTFAGSLVAAGKLQGLVPSRPILLPARRTASAALVAALGGGTAWLVAAPDSRLALSIVAAAALIFGVTVVVPIGGADMPVVISLLNALTGTAVAMAGFVLENTALILAGALVGASGAILTRLMAEAMNRSITGILAGGFGTGDTPTGPASGAPVRTATAEDVAIQLAYASRVIIVPGYGLAAAQAQHELAELADALQRHGVRVDYAVHPVAGRMPGHMNVLLAEADVPYSQLKEMEEINPEFPQADVALVVGANDVTNPAARRPGNPVSGMPIIDADRAKSVVVIKRSMGHGYAGIDNELFTGPKTTMFFSDAKKGLADLTSATRALTASAART